MDAGDFALGSTFDIKFTTINSSGVPTTLAGSPAIVIYPDNSTTEITGSPPITLTVDFDSRTGLHNVRVVATSGNGFATATNYAIVLSAGTVDGTSVNGYVVGHFSIENRSALRPTTAGRTLDVTATGAGGIDWGNIENPTSAQPDVNVEKWNTTAVPAEHTAGYPIVTIKDGTGTGEINTNAGAIALVDTLTTYTGNTPQTGDSFARLGAPAGASVSADIAAIEAQTDDIGVAGAGLTALPWNGAWDAEVAAAADIALMNRNLDKLVIASGTADSGSTTTMVDAARTEGDNDYWKGRIILFTSGTIAGQCAIITDFVAATDTFTFSPALTQAVGTQNYVILPNVSVWEDILAEHLTAGTTGNALNAAGSAGDPWSTALPGAYGAGTAGKILGDRLFKLGNEAHAGTSATLTLERIIVAATTSNQPAMKLTGNGTGPGLQVKGGSTGIGAWFDAGDTSGVGLLATGHGVNGFGAWLDGEASNALVCTSHGAAVDAVQFVGEGTGSGLFIAGGATGAGLSISGGGTSGVGVQINTVSGDGIDITSAGGVDIDAVLANSATLIGAPVGASISADIAGVATAAIDGVLDGIRLSKNTAFNNFMFKMVLSSDHVSNGTGLTVTAERSLDGAAFAACANAVSEVGSGWYKINLAATDLNADTVALKFTAATADQRDILIVTQPKD